MVDLVKEIKVIFDVYSPPDKRGIQKIIKKNVSLTKLVHREDIQYIDEYIDHKGKHIKKYSFMKLKNGEGYKICHNFKEIKSWIIPEVNTTTIGFIYKNKGK